MNIPAEKDLINYITELVIKEMSAQGIGIESKRTMVPVSISARHLHLNKEDLEALFGANHQLVKMKDISQPGQFAAEEKVTLVGPKGEIKNVRVLGPLRKETQVEVSMTDARTLGIKPVIRESGDLEGTPGITLVGPKSSLPLVTQNTLLTIEKGCIVAERHIHMTPEDARIFGVTDGEKVSVKVTGHRGGIMDNVVVRVREDYALDMHIDVDEANAFGLNNGDMVEIVR
jgi:putative phosphotransacetylase